MKGRKPLCKPNDSPLPAITQPRLLFFRRRPIIPHAVLADFTAQLVRKVEPSARQVASARCAVFFDGYNLRLKMISIKSAWIIRLDFACMSLVLAWALLGVGAGLARPASTASDSRRDKIHHSATSLSKSVGLRSDGTCI